MINRIDILFLGDRQDVLFLYIDIGLIGTCVGILSIEFKKQIIDVVKCSIF
ncbi:hypothetical protein MCESTEHM2_00884 [Candidatus Methylopumilus universalis]